VAIANGIAARHSEHMDEPAPAPNFCPAWVRLKMCMPPGAGRLSPGCCPPCLYFLSGLSCPNRPSESR